jgi:hypothetical protein
MVDCLLGLAWVAIVLTPAFVASFQRVESHDGYFDVLQENSMQLSPGRQFSRGFRHKLASNGTPFSHSPSAIPDRQTHIMS